MTVSKVTMCDLMDVVSEQMEESKDTLNALDAVVGLLILNLKETIKENEELKEENDNLRKQLFN